MAKSKYKIKLAHGILRGDGYGFDYKVLQINNSTAYDPNQILEKNEVDDLCISSMWDVTIVPMP